jgi:hypothetical protein
MWALCKTNVGLLHRRYLTWNSPNDFQCWSAKQKLVKIGWTVSETEHSDGQKRLTDYALVQRTYSTGVLKVALPRVSSETLLYFIYNISTIQYKVTKKHCSNCCPACSMHIWHLLIITTKYFGKVTFMTFCIIMRTTTKTSNRNRAQISYRFLHHSF